MQVFEFYFNPKGKTDLIFESFCYQPENIYEKGKGSLCLVGFLKNVLPKNTRFLDNLANLIKQKYYSPTLKLPEKSLKEGLRKTNEFLENIAKKGDVSWLGNLSFAVITLKNYELNFAKVGDLKIFLLRNGQIIDIDQKLKFNDIEPYPLKIFGNIVSGKLAEDDKIMVLTKEVFELFSGQSLLNEIAKIVPFEEKKIREIFKAGQTELSKISGICLLIVLSKEILPKKEIIFKERIAQFSIWQIFKPAIKKAIALKQQGKQIKVSENLKQNLILILVLIFFFVLGFLIF